MQVLGAVLTGVLAGGPDLPQHVILDVGLVRISPHRPGGNETWDKVTQDKPRRDKCDVAEIVPGGPGHALAALCDWAEATGTQVAKHLATDPDAFVRVVSGPAQSYRSHTVVNTLSHVFHFRVVVPTDAIPQTGIEVYVQD